MRFGIVHPSLGHAIGPEEAIKKVVEYGGLVYAGTIRPNQASLYGELAKSYQLELITGWSGPYIEQGPQITTHDFEQFCREVCLPLGIRTVTTSSSHHRWRKDPPLEEQLTRLSAALKRLCPVAADAGVTLALENHADYRADEILSVLERVDSPQLRVNFDSGNPFLVAEEPLEAARKLAPYTVTTHIKDMKMYPATDPQMPAITGGKWVSALVVAGTSIGEGDVDIPAIVEILASSAPTDMSFMLEVETFTDRAEATARSVQYVKKHFAKVLEMRAGAATLSDQDMTEGPPS